MENSGNEAKKYLKTNDITFFNGANFVRFARKSAPIAPQKEQVSANLQKRTEAAGAREEAELATFRRLHVSPVTLPSARPLQPVA